jgi:hypothetical protein
LDVQQQSNNILESIVNQSVEDKDESIGDDIEIIPSNILQDDFVQLDINEYNEQSNVVCFYLRKFFFSKSLLLGCWSIICNKNSSNYHFF